MSLASRAPAAPLAVRKRGTRDSAAAPWSRVLYPFVLATVLWAPLPFGSVEAWAVGLLRLIAFALASVWAVVAIRQMRFVVASSPIQLVLVGAVLLGLAQTVRFDGTTISADPFATRQFLLTLTAMSLLFSLALVALDTRARLLGAALAVFWCGFAISVFGIVQNLSGTTSIYWFREINHEGVSIFGPFVNKNHFAGLVELWAPVGVGLAITGAIPGGARFVTAFAAVVMGVAVAISRSRAGVLCFAAEFAALGLLVLASFSRRQDMDRRKLGAALVLGIALLAAGVWVGVGWVGLDSVARGLSRLPDEIYATDQISRKGIWLDTIRLIEDHPAVGVGLGAYATAFPQYGSGPGIFIVRQAHNDYLQALAEGGIVGGLLAVLFGWFLVRSLLHGLQRRDRVARGVALGAAAGCVGLLLHSLVDFNLQIPSNALAFLFSTALVVRAAALPGGAHRTREGDPRDAIETS